MAAVDTTGAGDAHSGVFLAGLAAGLPPAAAARRANAAAALAVTRPGPAVSPSRAELDAFLAPAYALMLNPTVTTTFPGFTVRWALSATWLRTVTVTVTQEPAGPATRTTATR